MLNFGLIWFATDGAIPPAELAVGLEERGFESLFIAEHTHIPTSRKTPFLTGDDLPDMYWRCHDQFVALSMAAAATTTLKLGTGVTLVTEHDPINLAKQVASLDVLSEGRLLFGIGAGWNAEEMEDHGVNFKDRWKVTRERVLAMREIWTKDEPEYHGTFVEFPPMWSWPKPLQKGGPPVLMGAYSKWTPARIAEYCDGWLPIDGGGDMGKSLKEIEIAMEAVGRSMSELDITVLPEVSKKRGVDPSRFEMMIESGANRVLLPMPDMNRDESLSLLDEYVQIITPFC